VTLEQSVVELARWESIMSFRRDLGVMHSLVSRAELDLWASIIRDRREMVLGVCSGANSIPDDSDRSCTGIFPHEILRMRPRRGLSQPEAQDISLPSLSPPSADPFRTIRTLSFILLFGGAAELVRRPVFFNLWYRDVRFSANVSVTALKVCGLDLLINHSLQNCLDNSVYNCPSQTDNPNSFLMRCHLEILFIKCPNRSSITATMTA